MPEHPDTLSVKPILDPTPFFYRGIDQAHIIEVGGFLIKNIYLPSLNTQPTGTKKADGLRIYLMFTAKNSG